MTKEEKDKILKEIDNIFLKYPEEEEGDVTIVDIVESRHIGHSRAAELMRKMVSTNPDKYIMVKVRSESGGWHWVLRRK